MSQSPRGTVPRSPAWPLSLGLGSLLLLGLFLWQALFATGWPNAQAWLAPWSATPSWPGLALWWLQLPRAVAGLVVGASLGIAGALMQVVTRNPLASPDLLGITAGAQVGLILSLLLPAFLGLPLVFLGGLLAALFTFAMAGGWHTTPLRLTLAGVAIAQAAAAAITLFLSLNDRAAMVLSLWNTGSLRQLGWGHLQVAAPLLPLALLVVWLLRRPLDLSRLGDGQMRGLGLPPAGIKASSLLLASALTALAIQLAGPLGFIGLIAPNLLRLGLGVSRPSHLVALSGLWGAVLTLAADGLVRLLSGWISLPLGVLSALLGSLCLLLLLGRLSVGPRAAVGLLASEAGTRRGAAWPLAGGLLVLLLGLILVGLCGIGPGAWVFLQTLVAGAPEAWILLDLRLPRLLVDAGAGALLATSGLLLQAVTRNPLAGPEILGVSQSAGLAVLGAIILVPDLAAEWRFPLAWLGAGLALAWVIGVNLRRGLEPLRLVLTGFAISGLVLALSSVLIAQYASNVAQALTWMVGSSYGRTWDDVRALLPWLVLGLGAASLTARWLDLLGLDEGVASGLGLSVASRRLLLVTLASVLIAAAVAVVGPVAFVGLLVPHGVRLLGLHRARQRLLVAPLLGACLLVLADLLARWSLAPLDIPLGIATAALGAPAFLLLLARSYRRVRR
ncbi:iron ABC transporter permease [uncultured Pseudomonas sp.]|uniref:iron ABC transporter permease n=1 Tax=uncultured Pseudomonas sp. TaxID=114707 RepID=UPI0025D409E3|nr:iron ABC transporter permease [uncultured Pseudomonas sp.]